MDKHKKKKKKKTKRRETDVLSPKTWLGIMNPRRNLIARLVCFFILPTLSLLRVYNDKLQNYLLSFSDIITSGFFHNICRIRREHWVKNIDVQSIYCLQ
jgi:hypothetical protein